MKTNIEGAWFKWVLAILIAAVFALDMTTPLEVTIWFFYLLPLMLTLFVRSLFYPYLLAAICSSLTLIGFYLSPQGTSPVWEMMNRVMGIGSFWVAAILLKLYKTGAAALRQAHDKLEQHVGERTQELQKSNELLRASREQLRALATRGQLAREQDRTRIAREIHDHLGQLLTALKLDLGYLERRIAASPDAELRTALTGKMGAIKSLTDETIAVVQQIASELRPSILDRLGLPAAIEAETAAFAARTGIHCEASVPDEMPPLSPEQTTAVFRIFQEILTNVARHAEATNLDVVLSLENQTVTLEVSDNGRGMPEGAVANLESLGLLGMQERAAMLGGRIDFAGKSGKGTTVTLEFPTQSASNLPV